MGEVGLRKGYSGSTVVEWDKGEQVLLTPMEAGVWNLFQEEELRIITQHEVYETARESLILYDVRAVHNLISRLREKLGSRSILTIPGAGYVGGAFIPNIVANGADRESLYERPLELLDGDRASVYKTIYDAGDIISREDLAQEVYGADKEDVAPRLRAVFAYVRERLGPTSILSIRHEGLIVPSLEFRENIDNVMGVAN